MNRVAANYAKAAIELNIPERSLQTTKGLLNKVPGLYAVLQNPTIPAYKKYKVIQRIFPKEIKNLLCVLCYHKHFFLIFDIINAFNELKKQDKGIQVCVYYAQALTQNQMSQINTILTKQYPKKKIKMDMIKDASLLGGFLLCIGNTQYDYSYRSLIKQLEQKLSWR